MTPFNEARSNFTTTTAMAKTFRVNVNIVLMWKRAGVIPEPYSTDYKHWIAGVEAQAFPNQRSVPLTNTAELERALGVKLSPKPPAATDPQRQKLWDDGTLFKDDQGRTMVDVSKLFIEDDNQGPQP